MDLDDEGISKKFLWRSHKINFCQKKVINLKTRAKRSSKRKEKRFQCDKAVKLPKRRRDKKQNKGKIIRIKLDKKR